MSEQSFWRLRQPAADDDYQRVRRNGAVRYAYALPTTGCRTCARIRESGRVLPTACPPEWRERLQPRRGREHRVTNAEFAALRAELDPALDRDVRDMLPLEPGDRFAPALWRVPSRPEDDVLWPELGAALVSDRVRAAFEREGVTGARFSAVTPERVGRASPRRAPRTLRGEPEDALRRIPALSGDGAAAAAGVPAYWRMGVSATSTLPPSYDPAGLCPECGRPDRGRAPYPAAFQPAMWGGDDVFYLAHTLYVVVTDRVRALLENMSATNVVFEPAASPLPHV